MFLEAKEFYYLYKRYSNLLQRVKSSIRNKKWTDLPISKNKIHISFSSLQINQDHAIRSIILTTSIIFATFQKKRMSLRSNHMHHVVANQIRRDNFLSVFPFQTSLKSRKSSTNSSPRPIVFQSIHLNIHSHIF